MLTGNYFLILNFCNKIINFTKEIQKIAVNTNITRKDVQ